MHFLNFNCKYLETHMAAANKCIHFLNLENFLCPFIPILTPEFAGCYSKTQPNNQAKFSNNFIIFKILDLFIYVCKCVHNATLYYLFLYLINKSKSRI